MLLIISAGGCDNGKSEVFTEAPPVLVETMVVETETKSVTRRYTGYLHPWEAHPLGFLTGGRIREIRPSVGDELKRGELIATLVPDEHAVYTELASIQRDALEPNLERVRRLVERNILPRSELDEIEAKYEAALTQHRQANLALSNTRLTAPVGGVVMERMASEGQVIGPGMPVVVLLEVNRLRARFGVPQHDLKWFSEGREVEIGIPGVEDTHTGIIERIDIVPDTKTRTYSLSVTLDNAKRNLRVGMISHLKVPVREAEGLFVPLTSIDRCREGRHQVKVLDDSGERVAVRGVRIGERIGNSIQVLEGLSPGDSVLVRGQTFVREGDQVLLR